MPSHAQVITSLEALDPLEAGWRALAVEGANAFLTPEWCRSFFAAYADATPFIVTVSEGEDLVGVLPFALHARGILRFAGAALGDFFHPVCQAEDEGAVAEQAGRALRSEPHWRLLIAENAGGDWIPALARGGRFGRTRLPHRDEVLPYLPLDGLAYDEYLATRSRNLRSQLGRKRRKLEREHGARFRRSERPEELETDMETFFSLHDRRWGARGGSAALTKGSRAFHLDFARRAQDRGWLRLWLLEAEGKSVAAWYGWTIGGRYSYYLAGFDPAWARLSVGQVLLARTIEDACEEGAREYDLLLGDEEYKARFAEAERSVTTVAMARRWSTARAPLLAERAARAFAGRLPSEGRDRLKRAVRRLGGRTPSRTER